jgi:hypothetical protein
VHATAIAALLNEAWAVLGDTERRRQYDTRNSFVEEHLARGRSRPLPHCLVRPAKPARGSNRRTSTRLKTLFPVWVTNPPEVLFATSTCLDLSTSGMAFTLGSYVDVDTSVTLTLDLPSGGIETEARVVRCDPLKRHGRWKVAATFTHLDGPQRRQIGAFIEWERGSRLD